MRIVLMRKIFCALKLCAFLFILRKSLMYERSFFSTWILSPPLLCLLTNNQPEADPDLLVKTPTKAGFFLDL